MNKLPAHLRDALRERDAEHLLRSLHEALPLGRRVRRDGRDLVNLAGNDYLALAEHPRLKEAAIEAIRQHGVGAGASRLVSGHTPLHARVERAFAAFKHAEAALLCPTGWMANHAAITALLGPGDLACCDKLNHASLLDAARASGATLRVYPHLNTDKLARLLARHHREQPGARRMVITDAVFSMDGDAADLPRLCDLAEAYDAVMLVDEAHATGVFGADGTGLCEQQHVTHRVDIVVSTASKALGGLGGLITGAQPIIDTVVNHARSFIYTTAVPPAQAAAIGAAIEVVRDEPWRRERVLALARRVHAALVDESDNERLATPIVPVVVGDAAASLSLAEHLQDAGFLAPAIRPPTVAPGSARVRLSLRADLEDADVDGLIRAVEVWRAANTRSAARRG